MQAFLRELAAFNKGLCLITTRLPIADLADHESSSVLRRDLEQLSDDAGAKLLRALGVTGQEAELRGASNEFSGHCLALTLLGSYLTDAYRGDIRCRSEISTRLASDVRQGAEARKIMESYQTWLGEGPELAVLRILGLFDRPAEAKALEALRAAPAIPGLTDSLTDLRPGEWQMILARLRRARLLAGEDPDDPGNLDAHPLVREYFGEQLRREQMTVWKECNRRLYYYYQNLPGQLPSSFLKMKPLFLAVICGCKAGLSREALQDVYIPRIQRGELYYAANVLGAKGPLLSVLAHFFEPGCWGSFVKTAGDAQSLTPENQLFILMQAAAYLTGTLGSGSREARICYERAELLTHSVGRPLLLHTLLGQWRYTLVTDKLTAAMEVADRVYSVAQKQDDPKLVLVADNALACTHYFLGNFESSRKYALHGVESWRSGTGQAHPEDVDTPVVGCLCYKAFAEWHLGETASCKVKLGEAISLAKELRDVHALAVALGWAAGLAAIESNPAEVDRLASELIELSVRHQFLHWQAIGAIHRGWARSASGNTAEGIPLLEQGIRDFRATGWVVSLPYHYAQKAEVLHLADRTSEALEAIREAEKLIERTEEHQWSAELHRLRAVFLAALGLDENQIEEAFCESIRIAKEQKSVALENRSQKSYAEYRRERANGLAGS
jgi:tetratricopeptide (TPR) repeat protein